MKLTKTQIIIIGVLGGIVVVALLFAVGLLLGGKDSSPYEVNASLEMWGVFDASTAYQGAFTRFNDIYPNVSITYRSFDTVDGYENALLDALAAGQGPDIFMVRNNDISRKDNKIFPLPTSKYSLLKLRNDFPQLVEHDFAARGTVRALPLSIDTLALIYNQALLNEAAIVFPPDTWEKLQKAIPQLVTRDDAGQLAITGVALGGSENVRNAKDIISLLLLQGGVEMTNVEYSAATFATRQAADVLRFYTQFADSGTNVFTWHDRMPDSRTMFSDGRVAMIIDYASAISEIRARNPFINIGIALVPQLDGSEAVTYGHYWGYTVSRQSTYLTVAGDFILSLTTDIKNTTSYVQTTGKPPALKTVINRYLNDPDISVFTRQALTARSWPEPDPEQVTNIFEDMIDAVVKNGIRYTDALGTAERDITRLMGRRF
ncbi:MAG TPA: extracellular solute-binding protein [Candidatus Jorgensenbacteria bacterium]|nr:extracellular solute-binding protein [Candidatus Jorgensenbacteria bacterium]